MRRDIDQDRRDEVLYIITSSSGKLAARRHVHVQAEVVNADPPAECDAAVVGTLVAACETRGFRYERMVSRAYHDSLFMSRVAPTAMLFIPCRGGVSHRPDEYASPEDIARGALVLAEALAQLAG